MLRSATHRYTMAVMIAPLYHKYTLSHLKVSPCFEILAMFLRKNHPLYKPSPVLEYRTRITYPS